MIWRCMQTYHWPAPAKIGAGQYEGWAAAARKTGAGPSSPSAFKACELQVEIGVDAPTLSLTGLLAWVERLLGEMRALKKGDLYGVTALRNGEGSGLRVTLWEAG